MSEAARVVVGDVIDGLRTLDAGSVHCCVTSPPYWGLRDYGVDGQIGLEKTPEEFVGRMVEVFREVRRVLRDDGTLWLNLGDSYNGYMANQRATSLSENNQHARPAFESGHGRRTNALKPKDLCMMPWRVALALQADGWWLRSVICWAKKSPMPESVTDRPTSSWEPIFLMAKGERYFYDAEAVKESAINAGQIVGGGHKFSNSETVPGSGMQNLDKLGTRPLDHTRNQRNVWHLGPEPYKEAHFATFPTEIPRRAIKAGTSEKGCCAACGAPWRRVVEKPIPPDDVFTKTQVDVIDPNVKSGFNSNGSKRGSGQKYQNWLNANPPKTVGWEPGCTCGAEVVPCLVLDPFLGSGTTVAVAREMGRHGVGCELNPEYAALARERIGKAERPATFRSDRMGDAPLFVASVGGVA